MSLSLPLSEAELASINNTLSRLPPQEILAWAIEYLPQLYQSTAFGLTGLVTIDMLSQLSQSPPALIFIDTLYHFNETLDLVERVKRRYGVPIHVYRPKDCDTASDFEQRHGQFLWMEDEDRYDFLVKAEPARRAYEELQVKSVITGRRASQGGSRAQLQPLEVDSTGLLKLNPLFAWSFDDVAQYINKHNVPRNPLLDQGYKSVGDWHSTQPSKAGEGEREGRWAGRTKTECGLHKDYFAMRIQAQKKQREEELRLRDEQNDEQTREIQVNQV